MKQGFKPDVISTDLHTQSMNGGMKDMSNVMSKFLNLGMTVQEVVARSTWNPANVLEVAVQPRIVRMLNPLDGLSDVYYDKQYLERLRQMEPMKPQATLEFDEAPQVVVRWR